MISEAAAKTLGDAYTGAIHDALKTVGLAGQVLPPALRPLSSPVPLHGPAFVISGWVDEAASEHDVLSRWTALLARIPAGHVVVCQPNDGQFAHMGELSARTLSLRGVLGYIVDGGCRDCDDVTAIGLPVWMRYRTPAAGPWLCDEATSVTIGTATVATGDYVVADGDGVVVVPAGAADQVAHSVGSVVADERLVRAALENGGDPHELFREYGRF